MKHPNSSHLLAYWNRLRGNARTPDRLAVTPKDIPGLLPDIFILDTSAVPAIFRLAGTRACAIHMKELGDLPFAALWDDRDRTQIETVVEAVGREMVGAVIGSSASTQQEEVSFETLLLPLLDRGRQGQRLIGTVSVLGRPWSLGSCPLGPHSIVSMRMLVEGRTPASALRAAGLSDGGDTSVIDFSRRGRVPTGVAGRKVRHLLVIEGGAGKA